MDITPILDTLYSQAECLVARNGEICDIAGRSISEKASAVVVALSRSIKNHQEKAPAP